jgi:hypothetical protein
MQTPNKELGPYANAPGVADNEGMSMYAELLTSAQVGLLDNLQADALLCYALDCRSEMLATGPVTRATALSALAVEVAYDCALLGLCAMEGIETVAADFSHPAQDRRRLEVELKGAGIDLTALARRWRGPQA